MVTLTCVECGTEKEFPDTLTVVDDETELDDPWTFGTTVEDDGVLRVKDPRCAECEE